MAHFAKIEDGLVTSVIVITQEVVDSSAFGDPDLWVQTSYNTRGGVHYDPISNEPDGGVALRKNYAGIGYAYDKTRDAFYQPQPYPSWTLDDDTCLWNPPTASPDDGKMYEWDENNQKWILRNDRRYK